MTFYPGSTIRIRLFLLVILAVIPLFGLTLYTAARDRQYDIDHIQGEALKLARLVACVQERQIDTARQFLATLAHTVEETDEQPGTCSPLFRKLLQELPVYSNFFFVDKNGNVRGSAVPFSGSVSVADQPWFQHAVKSGDFTIEERAAAQPEEAPSMALCVPVFDASANVDGLVCASLALEEWLAQAMSHLAIAPDASVTILNRHGKILARYPEPEKWTGLCLPECPAVQCVLSGVEGVADTVDLDGTDRIFGFTPLQRGDNRNFVNVGINRETALATATQKLNNSLVLLGLIFGLTLLVAMASADFMLLDRIRPLMSAAKLLGDGDLSTRTGIRYGRSELSQLARTFDQMADGLERRQAESEQLQKALQDIGRQFRSIFDNAFQFTAVLEPGGALVEANKTALDFAGLTNADVFNRPFWETPWWTVSPPVQQRLKEAVARAARGEVIRYEVDNQGAGGRIVTVDFSLKPLWNDEGKVRFLIAEGRDISERKRAEAALARSRARYMAIVEDQTELISRFSPDMKLTFVNGAYCRYFGELKAEILGKDFWHHVPRTDQEKLRLHIDRLDRENPVATIEHLAQKPEGTLRWLKWTDRAIFDDQDRIVEYQAVGRDITDRKQAEESLRASEKELRTISSQLLTAQEDERKRIARELHDATGQSLSAIKFAVEKALVLIGKDAPPEGLQALEDLVPTVRYAIEELRRIMRDLRPSILDDLGVVATINWFCRDFQKIYSSIQIRKTVNVREEDIPEPLKIALFRVVQEAMNNIAKHSEASTVDLSLRRGPSGIELTIDDDGVGFHLESPVPDGKDKISFGLSSMRERIEASGGKFSIHSVEGKGTSIRGHWPCVFKDYNPVTVHRLPH